jgi:hypothetical protein
VFRTVLDPPPITAAIKSLQETLILGQLHSVNIYLTKRTLSYAYILQGVKSNNLSFVLLRTCYNRLQYPLGRRILEN